MVHKNILIIGLVFIVLSSVALALDTNEYDDCVDIYEETSCKNDFCSQNRIETSCSYQEEWRRLVIFSLYPKNCLVPLKQWNSTEEVNFLFDLNTNADQTRLHKGYVCSNTGGTNFPEFSEAYIYYTPARFVNFVKLYKSLYYDNFGVPYLKKPSKHDLKEIYSSYDNSIINGIHDGLIAEDMSNNQLTVLSCNFDCDYNGEADIDKEGEYFSYDYTKGTRFINNKALITWNEVILEQMKEDCSLSAIIFIPFRQVSCSYLGFLFYGFKILNKYPTINLDEDTFDYDYTFYYSKTPNAQENFACKYPKSEYSDENVTVAVECAIGRSWESIMYNPGSSTDIDWASIGFPGCKKGEPTCRLKAYTTFNLNSTSGQIHHINSGVTWYNETMKETIDDFKKDNIPFFGQEATPDQYSDFGQGTAGTGTVIYSRDINRDSVVLRTIQLSKDYVFSSIVMISYILQLFMFMTAFAFILKSFKLGIKAVKDTTDVKKYIKK